MSLRRVSAGVGPFLVCLALAAQGVDLRFQEAWGAVWGGKPAGFHVLVGAAPAAGRLVWDLQAGSRSIARGERAVNAAAAAQPIALDPLVIPPVKPGVAMSATLTVSFLVGNDTQPAAQVQKPVWIFADNPFMDRSEWLKKLAIRLYAPQGRPVPELLRKAEIPFEPVANASDVSDLKSGVVLVAPGVAEGEAGRLTEALMGAAARGLTVL